MVSGSNGYSFCIQHHAHIKWVHTLQNEGKHSHLMVGCADQSKLIDLAKFFSSVCQKFVLIRMNILFAKLADKIDCFFCSYYIGNIGCPCFKLKRDFIIGSFLKFVIISSFFNT